MAVSISAKLKELQTDIDLRQATPCSYDKCSEYAQLKSEGKPLPDGIVEDSEYPNSFYEIYTAEDLSEKERIEYILLRQYRELKIIKNCVLFFTILTAISLIIGLFMGLGISGAF